MKNVINYVQQYHELRSVPDIYQVTKKNGALVNLKHDLTHETYEDIISFCSNDILGLSQHPYVKQTAIDTIEKYGTSNSGSEILAGRNDLHVTLENTISKFKGLKYTHLFLNAWMATQAFIDAICHQAMHLPGSNIVNNVLLLTDNLNHSSIQAAVFRAANMTAQPMSGHNNNIRYINFHHNDMKDLKHRLEHNFKEGDQIVVLTDGVFSMDGDVSNLPEIINILQNYDNAVLYVDEAHATGAIGKNGKGSFEYHGITPKYAIDKGVHPVILTTFSKFGASAGAAISTDVKELREILNYMPSLTATVSLAPALTGAALAAFEILQNEPHLVQKATSLAKRLRDGFNTIGILTSEDSLVVPAIFKSDKEVRLVSEILLRFNKFWVPAIWYYAKPRLRIVVSSMHNEDIIDELIEAFKLAKLKINNN